MDHFTFRPTGFVQYYFIKPTKYLKCLGVGHCSVKIASTFRSSEKVGLKKLDEQ